MEHKNTEGQNVRIKIVQKDHVVLGVLHSTDGSTESAIARSMAITDTEWAKCHHLWSETATPVKRRMKTAMRYVQKFICVWLNYMGPAGS